MKYKCNSLKEKLFKTQSLTYHLHSLQNINMWTRNGGECKTKLEQFDYLIADHLD